MALETVTAWQKDFHSRWRDIERLCSISIRERAASSRDAFRESKSSPQFSTISGSDHESTTTAVRQLTGMKNKIWSQMNKTRRRSILAFSNYELGKPSHLWWYVK